MREAETDRDVQAPRAEPAAARPKGGVLTDAFALKLVAVAAMTADHVGALLYPEALWLRAVGRLAMPILAFLLVEGYRKTSNLRRYALRLLAFALVAQPVYRMAFPHGLNVLFDLLAGLGVIRVSDRLRSGWLLALFLAGVSAAAVLVALDWWHLAVLMIFVFHRTRGRLGRTAGAMGVLLVVNFLVFVGVSAATGDPKYVVLNTLDLACLLAFPLLRTYDGRRGRDGRYFFYAYYPAHLLVLLVVKRLLF